jgi:hypothetical protein
MTKNETDWDDPGYQELGRRVSAALVSYQMGNALQTEYIKLKDAKIDHGICEASWTLLCGLVASIPIPRPEEKTND